MRWSLCLILAAAVTIAGRGGVGVTFGADSESLEHRAWTTLHGDVQRTGFYPSFPKGPFKLVWRKELWRELTGPRAEVIVAGGRAFLGTYAGRMYAWDSGTGEDLWVRQAGGAIGHSPAVADGTLYFGSMDRRLWALDAASGAIRWQFECEEGIWVSPTVHDGKVVFGDRAGVFHALHANDGSELWRFETGGPILQTASISEDGTTALFTSEDMHVHCLRIADGSLIWKSRKLAGVTARDYFPVIFRGLVFVTTSPVRSFHATLDEHQRMLVERTGFHGEDKRYIPGGVAELRSEQDFIVPFLRDHPDAQSFHAFRLSDGSEPWIAPILYTGGLHNPMTLPTCNPLTGEVFTQVRSAYTTWDGGGEVRPFTGFGKLDLNTGRVALLGHGYASKEPGRPPGDRDKPWGSFNYIGDETQALSCAPGLLINTHQGNVGVLDLEAGRILNAYGRRDSYGGFYGPANFGWESDGGPAKAEAASQPYGIVNEWHGPARAIVSVASGRVYFHVGAQVLCLAPENSEQQP